MEKLRLQADVTPGSIPVKVEDASCHGDADMALRQYQPEAPAVSPNNVSENAVTMSEAKDMGLSSLSSTRSNGKPKIVGIGVKRAIASDHDAMRMPRQPDHHPDKPLEV